MSRLFKHLKINEGYIAAGTVSEWIQKLGDDLCFYEVKTYDENNVTIKRIKGPTDKKSKNNDLINALKNWDGIPIVFDGPIVTYRGYVSQFNKEFNDTFKTRQIGVNKLEVHKNKESILKKETFSVSEYKFVRNELLDEIFNLQKRMFGFDSEMECAVSLIEELEIKSKPDHMKQILLKHENNRLLKKLNGESMDVKEIVSRPFVPPVVYDEVLVASKDESPLDVENNLIGSPVNIVTFEDYNDDDQEPFDWENELIDETEDELID